MENTGKRRNFRAYFRDSGVSSFFRAKIWRSYKRRLGDRLAGMNYGNRERLHDAIFEVEDEFESRAGGQPDHPQVVAMNSVRNLVLDDLRWNESCST